MAEKWFNDLMEGVDFNTFSTRGLFYLNELKNFHFSLFNPLLWIIFCGAFLILSKRWGPKKSFSFCSIITAVLLATTWLENYIPNAPAPSGLFDATIMRLISLFIIMLISIYYFFIKN